MFSVLKRLQTPLALSLMVVSSFLLLVQVAHAQADATIAQSFHISQTVGRGTLVSLKSGSQSVKIATIENSTELIGLVTDKPLIAIGDGESQVQVVTSGIGYALVSDLNGDVKKGDEVAVSAIDGIGAKALTSTQIVGKAVEDFSQAQLVKEHTVKDNSGVEHTVKVGLLQVNVNPTYYEAPGSVNSLVPGFLQSFANSLAGHEVSPIRVLVSLTILVAAIAAIAILFYSSVRFSITAIGRNPLSSGAVHKGMAQVMIIGGMILLVTLIAVYLVLVI